MGDGGLVPATADETWTRRLGDCKAKTALLLALLRELGVTARPVLVSTVDNALDRRLPIVGAFDHVIVQAEVDGAMVWLDGTRSGDRAIADLATPAYGWVLPVGTGGDLVRIDEVPLRQAQRETILTFDATGGLYADTAVSGEMIYRGDFATLLQSQLSGAPAGQRDAYMRASWTELVDELQITSVRADYDREANLVRLTMAGTAKLDWSSAGSRRLEVPMSRLSWSVGSRRPEGPYRDLPVATNHPWFTRFRTVLVLPNQGEGFRTFGTDIDETLAGYSYLRTTSLVGGVITMDRSVRSLTSELTEADRAAAVDPLERLSRGKAEIIAPSNYQATPQDMTAWESDTPTTSREYVARGLALNDTRQPDQALAAFDRAIEIEPSNANAWANRGIVKFWQGNEEAAGLDFDRALELNPAERVALNGRGLLAMKQQRFAEAVEAFTDSLEQSESEDPWALSMRSNAYLGLGDYERALTDTRRLRSLQPDRLETALLEVTILLATERLSEADELAESLAALHPDEPSVLLGLARLKSMQNEHPAADRAYSAVLAVTPEDTNVLIARAETQVLMGDAAGARADLQTARGLSGDDADLLNGLCWTQAVARFDLEQALADCDAALRIMPDSAGIIDSRGLVLLRMERHADAIAAYNQALALQADQPTSLYGRGLARLALGLTAEGQADIDAAVAIYPHVASELEPSAQIGIPIRD